MALTCLTLGRTNRTRYQIAALTRRKFSTMSNISVSSSFYAYLSRLRWIKRWGLKRNAHDENVMEHSWEVAVIAHTLALIKNRYYGGTADANAIATAALYHDITEVITGDLPTPIKYHSKAINAAYKQIEQQAENELLSLLPAELRSDFEGLIQHEKMPPEHVGIIKAADKISAYLKCQAELKAGNSEFELAAEQLALAIKASEQAEVIFFMQAFVPSCGLTLDGLMKTN